MNGNYLKVSKSEWYGSVRYTYAIARVDDGIKVIGKGQVILGLSGPSFGFQWTRKLEVLEEG